MKKQLELEAGPFEDLITEADEGMPRGSETLLKITIAILTAGYWLCFPGYWLCSRIGGRHV